MSKKSFGKNRVLSTASTFTRIKKVVRGNSSSYKFNKFSFFTRVKFNFQIFRRKDFFRPLQFLLTEKENINKLRKI